MNTRNLDDQVESTEKGAIEVPGTSQNVTATTSAASKTEFNSNTSQ